MEDGKIKAYFDEWQFDELSQQWSHPDGWWVDNCGVLVRYEKGEQTYENTSEFIKPTEAKLAAFLIGQWPYVPVKHPESCHCIYCD